MEGLLDEVLSGQQEADMAATVILSNLVEVVEAGDLGLDQAIRTGVIRKISAKG